MELDQKPLAYFSLKFVINTILLTILRLGNKKYIPNFFIKERTKKLIGLKKKYDFNFFVLASPAENEFRNPPAFIPQTPFCGRNPNPNPRQNKLAEVLTNPFPRKYFLQNFVHF